MVSTSARRLGTLQARLLAIALAIAAEQAWAPSLIGDGIAPSDDPESPYYRSEIAPPSWQGRPYAIPDRGRVVGRRQLGLFRDAAGGDVAARLVRADALDAAAAEHALVRHVEQAVLEARAAQVGNQDLHG